METSLLSRAARRREINREISRCSQDYLIKRNRRRHRGVRLADPCASLVSSLSSFSSSSSVDTLQRLSFLLPSSFPRLSSGCLVSPPSRSFFAFSSSPLVSTSLSSSSSCCLPAYIRIRRDVHTVIREISATSFSLLQGLSPNTLSSSFPVSLSCSSPFLSLSFFPSERISLLSPQSLSSRSSTSFFSSFPRSHSSFSTLSSSLSRHSEEEPEERRREARVFRKKEKERIHREEQPAQPLSSQTENVDDLVAGETGGRRKEEEERRIPLDQDRSYMEGREDKEEKKKRESARLCEDRERAREEEEEDFEKKLMYWIDRVRSDQDTGSGYMLKQILEEERTPTSHSEGRDRQPEGDTAAVSSSSSFPSLGGGEKQKAKKTKEEEEEETTKKIVQEIESLIIHRSQLSSEIGELLSYRHQSRREMRRELLALGLTGVATAFAAAIHPIFFLATIFGLRSVMKARQPELQREAGVKRLKDIQQTLRLQEERLFALTSQLVHLYKIRKERRRTR